MKIFILLFFITIFLFGWSNEYNNEELASLFARKLALPVKHTTTNSYLQDETLLSHVGSIFERVDKEVIFILPGMLQEYLQIEWDNVFPIDAFVIPPLTLASVTLQDVLYQLEDNSLVVSHSYSDYYIQNIAVSTSLLSSSKQVPLATYIGKDGNMKSLYNIPEQIVSNDDYVLELLNSNLFGTYNKYTKFLEVEISGYNTHLSTVHSNIQVLLSQLSQIYLIVQKIQTEPKYQQLCNDDSPDLFLFAIDSLQLVSSSFGISSNEYKASLKLVIDTIKSVSELFSTEGNGKKSSIDILLSEDTSLEVVHSKRFVTSHEEAWIQSDYVLEENVNISNNTNEPDVEGFQVILWSSVILIAVIVATIYLMVNIDTGEDTLLYRTPLDIEMTQQRLL